MAVVNITLDQLAILGNKNAVNNGMSDLLSAAPLVKILHSVKASNGNLHQYIKEVGSPVVGFRDPYYGLDNSTSTFALVTATLKYLDGSYSVDQQIADNYGGGASALIDLQGQASLKATFAAYERQIFNGDAAGTDANHLGFAGFLQAINAKSNTMFVDAGGTTAGACTSVYVGASTPDEKNIVGVIGNGGQIEVGETFQTLVLDVNGKPFNAYRTKVAAMCGVTVGSANSLVRVGNIDATHKINDALLLQAIVKVPDANFVALNYRALLQLQAARTAQSPTGATAPIPVDVFGVPIVLTRNILDNEAVVA